MSLTHEQLLEALNYSPDTGEFRWRKARSGVNVGAIAGSSHRAGYRRIMLDRRGYSSHRLAWLYIYGTWPSDEIDHINGLRNDNRIVNLRDVSRSGNSQNQRRAHVRNKSTGVLGVFIDRGKCRAKIMYNGKVHHLGNFKSVSEASAAYLAAKRVHHSTSPG